MDAVFQTINDYFMNKYPHLEGSEQDTFLLPNNKYYYVDTLMDDDERAYLLCGWDGEHDPMIWTINEDSDLFFLWDYDSPEDMARDMELNELMELDEVWNQISTYFASKYPHEMFGKRGIFELPNNRYCYVYTAIRSHRQSYLLCVCDEENDPAYLENYEDSKEFYLSDYDSVEDMIVDMEKHELEKKVVKRKINCPVCGKYTFKEADDFDICPICWWENDGLQYDEPDFSGGANDMSLNQARLAWKNGEKVK